MRSGKSMEHSNDIRHHQNQIDGAVDHSSYIGTKESWEDRLLKKYVRSTRTWKDDMPLGDMASMVKIKCPSNRGEDDIVSKVMRRLLIEKKQKVTYNKFCLAVIQIISQHFPISIFLLQNSISWNQGLPS